MLVRISQSRSRTDPSAPRLWIFLSSLQEAFSAPKEWSDGIMERCFKNPAFQHSEYSVTPTVSTLTLARPGWYTCR